MSSTGETRVVTWDEVRKHNKKNDCWVVINGNVYDLTEFAAEHPGGSKIITRLAGKDGSEDFNEIHPSDMVQRLGREDLHVGIIEQTLGSAPATTSAPPKDSENKPAPAPASDDNGRPELGRLLNVFDFEAVASKCMEQKAWDYYSSGADDEITLRENHLAFHRLWLRPRILVNVSKIDMTCTILGQTSALPVYFTATALARLAHPDGEQAIVRAAAARDLIYMLPTLSSCSLDEMINAKRPGQVTFFQLYVNSNRSVTERLVKRAEAGGCKGLFVTVDAPQLGRREKDMRHKFTSKGSNVQKSDDAKGKVGRDGGAARAISQFIDPSLSWSDLAWLKTITNMPIVLKGVQCGEDAVLAAEHGVAGIVLSNHGGRQLDSARSGVEVLAEVMSNLRAAGLQDRMEVYVDGGIRRGVDIFKCLALGAKAVGIGRPVLYSLASYGREGVERMVQMLEDELTMTMRLMGTPTLADIRPAMVCHKNIGTHVGQPLTDHLTAATYIPLEVVSKL